MSCLIAILYHKKRDLSITATCVVESLRVESNGCVGVLLTFGEPTGLELPEVEVPGSGRLLPAVGEIAGGVTEDITMVGGFTDASKLAPILFSITGFVSTVKVDIVWHKVDITGEVLSDIVFKSVVVVRTIPPFPLTIKDVVITVFVSIMVETVDWVLPSMLLDLSLLSVEFL